MSNEYEKLNEKMNEINRMLNEEYDKNQKRLQELNGIKNNPDLYETMDSSWASIQSFKKQIEKNEEFYKRQEDYKKEIENVKDPKDAYNDFFNLLHTVILFADNLVKLFGDKNDLNEIKKCDINMSIYRTKPSEYRTKLFEKYTKGKLGGFNEKKYNDDLNIVYDYYATLYNDEEKKRNNLYNNANSKTTIKIIEDLDSRFLNIKTCNNPKFQQLTLENIPELSEIFSSEIEQLNNKISSTDIQNEDELEKQKQRIILLTTIQEKLSKYKIELTNIIVNTNNQELDDILNDNNEILKDNSNYNKK
ncbi:MAG: hypothetical protein E7160_03440 [Firmicutes bacterium]|nr:hypothetical protein [Bacillota bacterium]